MSRAPSLLAWLMPLALVVPLSAMVGACADAGVGSPCSSLSDCDSGFVCVYPRPEDSEGICIDPNEDHGALPQPPQGGGLSLQVHKNVDILFVIDNSGSMAEEQLLLANTFGSFISVLEADEVDANYRIGITTTDNGNPWCPPGSTTPEGGKLVLSSCKERLGDFILGNGDIDQQDAACNDICTLSTAELEILPTTTDVDPNPAPRPWLERIEGKKNIPESTSSEAAFKCFAPQGINGCGFESPLESMYLSLQRAQTSTEANYGFMRSNALLAVVFLTDEIDCSANKEWSEIFASDGLKTFWSDPSSAFPSSAVCWNAGVQCQGDPNNYESCDSINKDVSGNLGVSDADAVLFPMSRYLGLLDGLESEKQQLNADQELIVAVIAGVDDAGSPFYADVTDSDPEFQESFGIGPGCTGSATIPGDEPIRAVPPVRLRELAEGFNEDGLFSICKEDYSEALGAIAAKIRTQLRPSCYTRCVADSDPTTEQLEPECSLEQRIPGGESESVPECARDANGYLVDDLGDLVMPAEDAKVCFAMRTDHPDSPLTTTTTDDLSPSCVEGNYNLEFEIARRTGFPAAGGAQITASCTLAEFPELACPGIGG